MEGWNDVFAAETSAAAALAGGVLLAFVAATLNAWAPLVEILR